MTPVEISEVEFETAIENALTSDRGRPTHPQEAGETRAAYGEGTPGGYHRRTPEQYDRHRCLLTDDLVDFVIATQPRSWKKLREHHGEDTRVAVAQAVARHVEKRGTLSALRDGVKVTGVRLRLAYFRPVSGLNEELQMLYEANVFSVVRQLKYSESRTRSHSIWRSS